MFLKGIACLGMLVGAFYRMLLHPTSWYLICVKVDYNNRLPSLSYRILPIWGHFPDNLTGKYWESSGRDWANVESCLVRGRGTVYVG